MASMDVAFIEHFRRASKKNFFRASRLFLFKMRTNFGGKCAIIRIAEYHEEPRKALSSPSCHTSSVLCNPIFQQSVKISGRLFNSDYFSYPSWKRSTRPFTASIGSITLVVAQFFSTDKRFQSNFSYDDDDY